SYTASLNSTPSAIKITPDTFFIPMEKSQTFIVTNIGDIYGNGLIKGTSITVTTNNGILGGSIDANIDDSQNTTSFSFTLSSEACEISIDEETEEKTIICPEPEAATVTVSIGSSTSDEQSSNGVVRIPISGTINAK
ncbi:MAG: hypothetical protein IMF12_10685, partial [Proteobacteria bacterium]|nr:hypothetical protein [Pseudomonadota bacterium]